MAGIYGCFTEGLDTPDLIEARALLDELGSEVAKVEVPVPRRGSNTKKALTPASRKP